MRCRPARPLPLARAQPGRLAAPQTPVGTPRWVGDEEPRLRHELRQRVDRGQDEPPADRAGNDGAEDAGRDNPRPQSRSSIVLLLALPAISRSILWTMLSWAALILGHRVELLPHLRRHVPAGSVASGFAAMRVNGAQPERTSEPSPTAAGQRHLDPRRLVTPLADLTHKEQRCHFRPSRSAAFPAHAS